MRKRLLYLIHDDEIFTKLRDKLETEDWEIEEYIFGKDECSMALVDSFYHELGTSDYLKKNGFQDKKILFLISKDELFTMLSEGPPVAGIIDDLLIRDTSDTGSDALSMVISARWGELPISECLHRYFSILQHQEESHRRVA